MEWLLSKLTLKDETDRLIRNVGNGLPIYRCVKSEKSEGIKNVASCLMWVRNLVSNIQGII
jgi:hypothetical protein